MNIWKSVHFETNNGFITHKFSIQCDNNVAGIGRVFVVIIW